MTFFAIMEILGTIAFAMSGTLVAIEKDLDYFGIAIFAIVTAIGGGMTRDVLLGHIPTSLLHPQNAIISILSAVAVIIFYKKILGYRNIILFFDAVGLAAFTATGAEIAATFHWENKFLIVFLAILTGTGGGVLRDVFAKEIPFIFRKEVYAVASIIGVLFYIALYAISTTLALYVCFLVTLAIRLYCMKHDIHLRRVAR